MQWRVDAMSWLKQTLSSSVGGKTVVAVTGIAMVGFLVAHLSGNLLVFAGPEAMSEYAAGLRKFPVLLLAARVGLAVMAVLHILVAVKLNLANRAARPVAYAVKNYRKASVSSRTMVLTGLLLLFYILFHLAHFTWRLTSPEIGALGHYDVYAMLILAFSNPLMSGLYILAMIVMGMHLSHGVSSLWQTLGLNHPKYNPLLRKLGPISGILLAAGFISIPVSVLLGIVK
jgi:succinate dehydrogenase / fumarate reductase cytochrome b subunit